jgi:hypothetical protein
MPDNLIICPRCSSNACYHILDTSETKSVNIYGCFGCGYQTNDAIFNKVNQELVGNLEKNMPELYRDIKWEDENGNYWYPQTINHPKQGMVFADGKDKESWKWSGVVAKPINSKDKNKFKLGTTHVMDMTTKKEFDQADFMEALDYIGYFNKTFI